MNQLDDDYGNWRKERYQKFANEFNTWRSSRPRKDESSNNNSNTGSSSYGSSSGSQDTDSGKSGLKK